MRIQLRDGLPYITASIGYHGRQVQLQSVLLDTGSAGSIFSTDRLLDIGLQYEPDDLVHRIRGIGGAEFVFTKMVDQLALGELRVSNFEIEVGAMDYGFEIDGIVGMDFLTKIGAVIDLARLEVLQSLA
ncbi:MAG: retropepsin-like aspartic protease [bacterium]